MPRLLLAIVVLLAAFPVSRAVGAPAAPPEEVRASAAGEDSWQAHRKTGDESSAKGDYKSAAASYRKALSEPGASFPIEERVRMATVLSWGGELEASIRELESVLREAPGNLRARLQLARALSWSGRPAEAIVEADKVLAASPGDPDALVVKGNALRFRNDNRSAIRVFESVLSKKENFDARVGLAYACLAGGRIACAKENAGVLKPEYPYQEKELKSLRGEIAKATRPNVAAGYRYYDDSDENRVNRYSLSAGFRPGDWRWGVGYLYTDAADPRRDASDHELTVSADTRPVEWLGVGAMAGINWAGEGASGDHFVGSARADAKLLDGRVGASVSRRVFSDIAQLIENRIRYTEVAPYFEYPLPHRFSLSAGYTWRDFSDDNRSDDWQAAIRHAFKLKNPSMTAGYRVRYLDFRKETDGGYFDPSNYVSHRLDLSVYHEAGRWYVHLVPFIGYQSFRQEGSSSNGVFTGGEGLVGFRVTDSFSIELHGDGSDEAGATASGFNYYQVGLRANWRL